MKVFLILTSLIIFGAEAIQGAWRGGFCSSSQSGSYGSVYGYQLAPYQRPSSYTAQPSAGKKCRISLTLPSSPCDVYVNGALLRSKVTHTMTIETPELPKGTFKYDIMVKCCSDSSKISRKEIRGIVSGGYLAAEMELPKQTFRQSTVAKRWSEGIVMLNLILALSLSFISGGGLDSKMIERSSESVCFQISGSTWMFGSPGDWLIAPLQEFPGVKKVIPDLETWQVEIQFGAGFRKDEIVRYFKEQTNYGLEETKLSMPRLRP